MFFLSARSTIAVLLLSPSALMAQTVTSQVSTPERSAQKAPGKNTEAKGAPPMQSVEVKGKASDYDPRRDDTATKTVLNSDEIRKYGDTNIYDVLKRAPGVTVTGNTIRMRGLGAGYTQILVNGDRPPPGFSLDALTPDQIERIEIMRAATAEYSTQSIAGTINIVLRKVVAKRERTARLGVNRSPENSFDFVGGTWADKTGSLSYFLNGALFASRSDFGSWNADQFVSPAGALVQSRESFGRLSSLNEGLALFPRLSWKRDNGDELNGQLAVQAGRGHSDSRSNTNNLVGTFPAPEWVETRYRMPVSNLMFKTEVNWIAKLAGGKLDLTVSAERSRRANDSASELYTENRALKFDRDWNVTTRIARYAMRGKFNRSLFDGHSLATGAEASVQRDDELRDRREQMGDAAPVHIVENFEPRITRLAAYVQDEWALDKQMSVYLGTRWEGVQTDSAGTGLIDSRSRNHVLSPVFQTLYKFPGKSGRQLRLALTRTYKAPTTDQLTARRFEAPLNTRFTPDSSGNPGLRPELANGIDVSFEQFFAPGALASVSASRRTISDYIRTRLGQDAGGRWLYQPINDGTAVVRSLEAELKLPLKLISAAADGFDARASVTRNWSRVSTVPEPNNRLDAQTPTSANAGIDYKKGPLGLGASLAYQQGGWVRISEAQSQYHWSRRDLDAYALWKLDSHYQLRLSFSNILRADSPSEMLYQDATGTSRQLGFRPTGLRTGLNLEIKL
jgi:outer membrane receptor for ferrienterochelin and colicins